ncbi:MAG: S16 family serine protease [Candidatus Nanopelagicales bacterium]|nr:S16 family serine protease [Candidatus Nanopelagicales bacterium]MDZ4250383.1 S16 family serine protease [Candidatus Nanopelagicales bacterium]
MNRTAQQHPRIRRSPSSRTRRNSRLVALALVAAMGLATACGTAAVGTRSTTVRALWYGQQPDGSYAHGVTPVEISDEFTTGGSDFSVDLTGLESAGTGDYWNAAAWSAATLGALASDVDPRGWSVSFNTSEKIDGPSAGGLMTLAVTADLAQVSVPEDVSMTGTIMPGGGLGQVSGIPEKIRAAAEARITKVFIPMGQRMSLDPVSGENIDVVDEGRSLGVEVKEVASVWDAYRQLIGNVDPGAKADPEPIDQDLAKLLGSTTKSVSARLSKLKIAHAPTTGTRARREAVVNAVARGRRSAAKALSKGKPIPAFADAALAEHTARTWNATAAAIPVAEDDPRREVTELTQWANALESQAEAALRKASLTPPEFLEQLTTLPDALTWADGAIITIHTVKSVLTGQDVDAATLVNAAAELAQAQYDLDVFSPTWIQAAMLTGHTPIPNSSDATGFLNSYADLLAQASQANMSYYKQTAEALKMSAIPYDVDWVTAAAGRWDAVRQAESWPQVAIKLATAISSMVYSADLVGSLGAVVDDSGMINAEGLVQIRDLVALDSQSTLARDEGVRLVRGLAGAKLDPSYARWNNEYGYAVFHLPDSASITDQERREGLAYQWYANLNAQLLSALNRSFQK